jgi:restriction system protein
VEIDLKELMPLLLMSGKLRREKAAQLKHEAAQAKYELAFKNWEAAKVETARQNAKAKALFEAELDDWWERAQNHQKLQQDENRKIDAFRQRYAQGRHDAVIEFLDAALSHAEYPDMFPLRWEMSFDSRGRALVIDYELPAPESFPTMKAVKYDVLKDSFAQSHWSEDEIAKLYEDAIYQTCLRTLRDVFAADEAKAVWSTTFNGWVNFTDKLRDTPARNCILSVQAGRDAISRADFASRDAKACFQELEGDAGPQLARLTPVIPICWLMRMDDPPEDTALSSAPDATHPSAQRR